MPVSGPSRLDPQQLVRAQENAYGATAAQHAPTVSPAATAAARQQYFDAAGRVGQVLTEGRARFQGMVDQAQSQKLASLPTPLKSHARYRAFAKATGFLEKKLDLEKGAFAKSLLSNGPVIVQTERCLESAKQLLAQMDVVHGWLEDAEMRDSPDMRGRLDHALDEMSRVADGFHSRALSGNLDWRQANFSVFVDMADAARQLAVDMRSAATEPVYAEVGPAESPAEDPVYAEVGPAESPAEDPIYAEVGDPPSELAASSLYDHLEPAAASSPEGHYDVPRSGAPRAADSPEHTYDVPRSGSPRAVDSPENLYDVPRSGPPTPADSPDPLYDQPSWSDPLKDKVDTAQTKVSGAQAKVNTAQASWHTVMGEVDTLQQRVNGALQRLDSPDIAVADLPQAQQEFNAASAELRAKEKEQSLLGRATGEAYVELNAAKRELRRATAALHLRTATESLNLPPAAAEASNQ